MSKKGPRRNQVEAPAVVAAVDAAPAPVSRFTKVMNAVKNHPFIAGGVAVTAALIGFDAIANSANIASAGDFAYGSACVAGVVAAVESAGYGAYRLGKAAYNNANMESVKSAGKTAATYAAKPFTFGFDMLKAGYNKLPSLSSFRSKAADAAPAANKAAAPAVQVEEVAAPKTRTSARTRNATQRYGY